MRIAVTGSIATDHLMAFPGRFADLLIPDQLDRVSLSFLADSLEVRRGGAAANIAVGLARLGLRPVLVGAVGKDFEEYGSWLRGADVDTRWLRVSRTLHTARFVCTTDADHRQIATFYAGAMAEAAQIDLAAVCRSAGLPDLVVIAPNDPTAMLRHTEDCRRLGLAFAADPSQQLARLDGTDIRRLLDGSRFIFTNEYESALLLERTGWSTEQVLKRTGSWITTAGAGGVVIAREGEPPLRIPAVPTGEAVDPTGAGDAFRAGFLAGTAQGLPPQPAARLGCALATLALETVGTVDYTVDHADLLRRVAAAYGPKEAAELAPLLPVPS